MHSTDRPAEKLLKNVVHDLRQPLGTIETSAYLLNRMLRSAEGQAYQYLCTIERQVDLAARILNEAAAELGRLRSQPGTQPSDGESRDFTKSETAAVT